MKKIFIFGILGVVLLVGTFLIGGDSITGNTINSVSAQEVTMYKSPSCGCCVGHAGYLGKKGFKVNVIADDSKLSNIKDEYNIPMNMRSCHTEIIGNYFVEGHVPIEAINKMVEEKPDIDGIALPNMPSGSPGMPGTKKGDWVIYAIKDGRSSEFMRI